ncbi:MAG: complex I 51 kDa subunit family protein, partial [Chloroflexia bacterium]
EDILGIEVPDRERALLRRVGSIAPDSLAEAVSAGAYRALHKALTRMTPEEVVEEVVRSGLQGRGGAGFPTGLKMRFTAAAARSGGGPACVVCNADESEPGTFKDRLLIEGDPHLLLEGIVLAGYAVGAREGYIYIRGEYAPQAALLERAVREAGEAGYLGPDILGTGFSFTVHLHRGAGAYICGEETALLESLEGKRGEPRLRPPYPTTYGAFGRPTLLNNVETLCNLPGIVAYGAEWYRRAGTEKSPGTKLYPISGHVRRRGCLEAPLGRFTLRQVIEGPAGGMRGPAPFKACHLGGAAGAIVGPEFLDIPLDFASCAAAGAMLGAGDIVVLDAETCLVDYVRAVAAFFRAESCGKCTPCRVGTERQLQLLDELTSGGGTPEHLQELLEWGEHMTDSSFCGLGQTAATAVLSALRLFPDEFEAHARGTCPAGVCRMRG